jgi:hypothetical protein
MAIDELALSLLSRQERLSEEERERRRKERRRARREDLLGKAAGIGLNIGNRILAEKTNDFLNSEQVFNQRIKYKTATNYTERIKDQEKLIQDSGLSASHYYSEQYKPTIKARADELFKEEKLDEDAYNRYMTEQADIYGKKMALKHNEALRLADQVISSDSYDNVLKMANKRPKDVGDYVIGLFRGKSKQNIDDEAFESIKSHAATQNADEFIEFFEGQYRTTRDLVRSHDFAKKVFPGIESVEFTTDEVHTQVVGKKLVVTTQTSHYRTDSEQFIRMQKPTNITMNKVEYDMRTPGELSTAENKAVESFNTNFNYGIRGHDILTTAGFEKFRAIVPEHIAIERIKNLDELAIVSEAWAKIVSEDVNLNSTGKDEMAKTAMLAITNTLPQEIRALQIGIEDDPEKREVLTREFLEGFATNINAVNAVIGNAEVGTVAKVGQPGREAGATPTLTPSTPKPTTTGAPVTMPATITTQEDYDEWLNSLAIGTRFIGSDGKLRTRKDS